MAIVAGDIILSHPPSCVKINLKNFCKTPSIKRSPGIKLQQPFNVLTVVDSKGIRKISEAKRLEWISKELGRSTAKRLIDALYKCSIPKGTWKHLQIVERARDVLRLWPDFLLCHLLRNIIFLWEVGDISKWVRQV